MEDEDPDVVVATELELPSVGAKLCSESLTS